MIRRLLVAVVVVLLPASLGARQAAPPKASKVALPAAIESAFKAAYPTATINHVSKEKENGQDIYEIESIDHGLHRDLNYKSDGTVIEVEEEVAEADFPAAVATAIKTRYPKATIVKREKLIKNGTTNYEVALKGGPGEVVLTPDGKWVSPKPAK